MQKWLRSLLNQLGSGLPYTPNVTIGGTEAGAPNLVTGNSSKGVVVRGDSAIRVSVRRNVITNNGTGSTGLGIDLNHDQSSTIDQNGVTINDAGDGDTGPNSLQNFPVLTSAWVGGGTTRVIGTLNSTAHTTFHLDFYANLSCASSGHGEGQNYLGTVSAATDGSGNASIAAVSLAPATVGNVITATATDPSGSTSEFSACRTVTVAGGITVTPTGGLITDEAGETATFTVRLNSVPSAPVTIPVSSSDTTEGTVSHTSLTFQPNATALNSQMVTVTGQDDPDIDGDMAYTIVLGAATSADPVHSGQNPPDIAATNRDGGMLCSPRPKVTVATANNGDGRLRVTIGSTTPQPDVRNPLVQLQFDAGNNALVHLPGQEPKVGPFNYDVPNQPTSFVFYVGRQGAGATHLPFRVIDGCAAQPWQTFVGGGATAF